MIFKIKTFIAAIGLSAGFGVHAHAAALAVPQVDSLNEQPVMNITNVQTFDDWMKISTLNDIPMLQSEKQLIINKKDTFWDSANHIQESVVKANETIISPETQIVAPKVVEKNEQKPETAAPIQDKTEIAVSEQDNSKPQEQPVALNKPSAETPDNNNQNNNTIEATTNDNNNNNTIDAKPVENQNQLKEITVDATAYTASCEGCSGITKTGIDIKANPNAKVIAVDPAVIPLGSKVYVEGYGEAIAGDIGGGINGHEIDVFIPSEQDALKWGRKTITVKILN
ncbi:MULTISPECIES: 3D domain-containing protein [Neobacillus]|uniref:3D domain-containing protein n=1 Tax=Neobacillus rhizophilus TaxID=2833579 RepID=A0A942U9M6_9BACI|nr:3D domain-containing protein [Neobacillus rhizophilus]MBS4216065.1 3D domain-containing protein [Neobacillus rhizophilus]